MIISARLSKNPRRLRACDCCGECIERDMLAIYGACEVGDEPYMLYAHNECIEYYPTSNEYGREKLARAKGLLS